MKVAFHDASGRPLERHVLLVRQYGTHGFDCWSANGSYGADLRQHYRDGLMSDDEKSALREMKFDFTDVLSSDGDLKCLVLLQVLDRLNWIRPSSQGPHKIVPRETDTISILFMLVVD